MLRLYGPLAIEGSDGVGLGQRATRGLIAYLALKPGPASSDELLEALWPGQDPAAIRSALLEGKTAGRGRSSARPCRAARRLLARPRGAPLRTATRSSGCCEGSRTGGSSSKALALIGEEPLLDVALPVG